MNADRSALTGADLAEAADHVLGRELPLDPEIARALDPAQIVAGRTALGGSAPERVHEHCAELGRRRDAANRWREERRAHAQHAKEHLVTSARQVASTGR